MRRRVTFSRNLTLSLSRSCRCYCKYCAFATHRAHLHSPDEVIALLDGAARRKIKELLVLTGEHPEVNAGVRERLSSYGHADFVGYVVWACERALERGLLPHTNLGVLHRTDLARLREVTASQGLMLESVRDDLVAHQGSPTKHPERRLETIRWAGELRIPFTSGILVGIGETPADRVRADAWELFSLLLGKSFPAGIRRVREHRALGHRTLLITGALDFVVEPLRPLFDDVVCARLAERDGLLTGEMIDAPPTGEARAIVIADYAAAEGLLLSESVVYADSASDLPMLEAVGHPVAVNAEPKLAAIARKRGWHIEQWTKAPGTPVPLLPLAPRGHRATGDVSTRPGGRNRHQLGAS